MRTPWANLRIVWVDLPSRVDRWGFTKIGKGVHYLIWQEMAFRRARELHATIGFDLVHHVSCGTISAPPRLWRLGVPFLWGPIGGGQTSPKSFRRYFRGERAGEILRSARVRLLPFYPPLRKAARHSVILATNRETIHILEEAGASVVYPLLDGALPNEYIPAEPVVRKARADTVFIWAGWHEPRKCLPLAIEALAQTHPDIRLRIAGVAHGCKRDELERLAALLGVTDRVEFLGVLTWHEMQQQLHEADGFLFTSIRDSFGTVVLEAMAHALPVIALDHQGIASHVPDGAAIKVPVTDPGKTAAAIAASMRLLSSSPELRSQIGRAGWEFARQQVWERRMARVELLIGPHLLSPPI
ncbi:MAG: hypothetical protein JWN34_2425 [Bryobacterales bacterium]|nr:hypothetical protein [Bryobacterales bacterium]